MNLPLGSVFWNGRGVGSVVGLGLKGLSTGCVFAHVFVTQTESSCNMCMREC